MTKQLFQPNIEEDLNRLHNVSLTEGQISTILYILEGYNDTSNDPDLPKELDNISKELEGVVDTYYNKNVSLTEGQISIILYILEGYNPLDSNGYDPEFREDIDNISKELEGVVDTYYNKNED